MRNIKYMGDIIFQAEQIAALKKLNFLQSKAAALISLVPNVDNATVKSSINLMTLLTKWLKALYLGTEYPETIDNPTDVLVFNHVAMIANQIQSSADKISQLALSTDIKEKYAEVKRINEAMFAYIDALRYEASIK